MNDLRPGALLLVALAAAACGEPPLLELRVVTPEGPDPLATADRLRLVVTQPPAESMGTIGADGRFSLDLKVEVAGAAGQVVLEGYAVDTLVARGETPPLALRPEARTLSMLVGRAGDFSTFPVRLTAPGHGLCAVLLTGRGLLLAGGADAADRPLAGAAVFNFFQLSLDPAPPMPEPRIDAVGAACGSGCALVALGATASGLAEKILRFDGQAWTELPDRLAPAERRRGAGLALLGDGTYLVVGGEGAQGPLDTALRLQADANGDPFFEVLAARSRAPRRRPALAGAGTVVLVVGGQPVGAPPAELFYTASSTFQALDLPGNRPASGSAVSELADGKLVIVGGRDESGNLIRDGWIVDPIALKVTPVPGCLTEGRAEHRLVRAGGQLAVVGGVTGAGPTPAVEILRADLTRVGQGSMAAPRTDFAVGRLGPGAFLVAGGRPSTGAQPVPLLEVFQTAVRSGTL